jgi:hypothetical protein
MPMKTTICALVAMLFAAPAFAAKNCTRDASGQVTCTNPNTGKSKTSNATSGTSSNGVTTTQTQRGGTAKTKNGKGVVTTPGGKDCFKTANNQGCR